MAIQWIFDPAPPSGARKGGNAAEYGFEGRIDTLVREVVQNSMDAGNPWDHRVDIRFRIIELSGEYLSSFLGAMEWNSLQDNLRAVPVVRGGKAIHRAMDKMIEDDRLLLLAIEDRGTDGLTGTEIRLSDTEVNRFSALVRDELYSDKELADAGGSFGLGKILLWAYSAYKTVIFSSVPRNGADGHEGLRFIGRTSLPYHETDQDGRCAGSGWLGVARTTGPNDGQYATSVWAQEGKRHANRCYCDRDVEDYGLTAVIVGFEEPGQDTRPVKELLLSIRSAVMESFWPALALRRVGISTQYLKNGDLQVNEDIDPFEDPAYKHLASLLKEYHQGGIQDLSRLEKFGDRAFRKVPIEIPRRLTEPDHPEFKGEAVLLVQLVEDSDPVESITDRIFRFRRPGMIVHQSGGKSLSITARPYIAAVLCGRASGEKPEQDRIEHFLRAAEPPEHDKWQYDTRAIKENYKTHGIKAKLERFEQAILRAVRELVSLPEKAGGNLPKELLKYLRFGDTSGGGNPRFLTSTIKAEVQGQIWKFTAKVTRAKDENVRWHAIIKLKYAVDGGSADDVHAIKCVTCSEATRSEIRNGDAYIEFDGDVIQALIGGETDPASMPAIGTDAAISIHVDGKKGGLDNV